MSRRVSCSTHLGKPPLPPSGEGWSIPRDCGLCLFHREQRKRQTDTQTEGPGSGLWTSPWLLSSGLCHFFICQLMVFLAASTLTPSFSMLEQKAVKVKHLAWALFECQAGLLSEWLWVREWWTCHACRRWPQTRQVAWGKKGSHRQMFYLECVHTRTCPLVQDFHSSRVTEVSIWPAAITQPAAFGMISDYHRTSYTSGPWLGFFRMKRFATRKKQTVSDENYSGQCQNSQIWSLCV